MFVLTISVFLHLFFLPKFDAKSIHISLQTNFAQNSLLAQAAEFFSDIDHNLYWDFFNFVTSKCDNSISDREDYFCSLNFSLNFLDKSFTQLLNYALTVHYYAPKIEMFLKIGNERINSILLLTPPDIFIDICDHFIFQNLDQVESYLLSEPLSCFAKTYSFDHSSDLEIQAILYGSFGSSKTFEFFTFLNRLVLDNLLKGFLFRPWYPPQKDSFDFLLSGYGVELAIKSTEYLVQDDISGSITRRNETEGIEVFFNGLNFTSLKHCFPTKNNLLLSFYNHLNQISQNILSVKQWQWNDLGFQICQSVFNKHQDMGRPALVQMVDIIQNFPVEFKNIYDLSVSNELREELLHNQRIFANIGLENTESITLLNGIKLDNLDPFKLFDTIREDLFLISSIHATGIAPEDIFDFLRVKLISQEVEYALDVRDESVIFINDIEKDLEYVPWTNDVQELLRPTFPGAIRQIRRNFFSLVLFFDPSQETTFMLLMAVDSFLSNFLPVRIGLVMKPTYSDNYYLYSATKSIYSCFNFIYKDSGKEAFHWLLNLHKYLRSSQLKLNINIVNEHCYTYTGFNASSLVDQYGNFEPSSKFFQGSGLQVFPTILLNGYQINIDVLSQNYSPNLLVETIIYSINDAINLQTRILQKDIYFGKLLNHMDVHNYLMNKPNVVNRHNYRILSPSSSYLPFFCFKPLQLTIFNSIDMLSSCQITNIFSRDTQYIFNPEYEFITKPLTIWLVADFSTKHGFGLLIESLYYISQSNVSRIALIFNCPVTIDIDVNKIFKALIYSQPEPFLYEIFLKIVNISDVSKIKLEYVINIFSNYSWFKYKDFTLLLNNTLIDSNHLHFSSNILNLTVSSRALIVNGRILGPLLNEEKFIFADFKLLEFFFNLNNGQELLEIVNLYSFKLGNDIADPLSLIRFRSNVYFKVYSSLCRYQVRNDAFQIPSEKLGSKLSKFDLKPRILDEIYYSIVMIVDPLTKDAQKLLSIVLELYDMLNIHLQLWLFPRIRISEFPLNRFYRFVLYSNPFFNVNGSLSIIQPSIEFLNIPRSLLLTLSLDIPHVWMVEVISSHHDLDNLQMENASENIIASFRLTHLLIEGQCLDSLKHDSLPGLQLTLESDFASQKYDSLVMANIGYFQLKSQPGVWRLSLIEQTPIIIKKHQGGEEIISNRSLLLSLSDFNGKFLVLYLSKPVNTFSIDKLNIPDKKIKDSFWDSLSNYLPNFDVKKDLGKDVSSKVINIFSIASGHLYERFLRIMMLSVVKNTNNPVKFWLLKNYFSPQFKKFIPIFSKRYNFRYELVEYKWPKWLRAQELKQRKIWGYKILFLDVLFPLKINRIIYIDADQVVRANILELFEMDLRGAPYGYVPFCDSKKEMDGFRFWKHGYWENLLRHRKYHISALYVIDLVRFREIGAGDRLRENYQALSHDPNSLANLDQDLPNSMIHSVPIFSLPQNWLWCETWCSDEEKNAAKTIDICNNPLTKEPKLKSARRIINEWVDYDNEVQVLFNPASSVNNSESNIAIEGEDRRHLEL